MITDTNIIFLKKHIIIKPIIHLRSPYNQKSFFFIKSITYLFSLKCLQTDIIIIRVKIKY